MVLDDESKCGLASANKDADRAAFGHLPERSGSGRGGARSQGPPVRAIYEIVACGLNCITFLFVDSNGNFNDNERGQNSRET